MRGRFHLQKEKVPGAFQTKEYVHKCTVCGITEKENRIWNSDIASVVKEGTSTAWITLKIMSIKALNRGVLKMSQ